MVALIGWPEYDQKFTCVCYVATLFASGVNVLHRVPNRPAKLGRVKTSRFTRTTKMRHPSTYDNAQCATRDAVTNIHVYQY